MELDAYKDLAARYVLQVFPDMIGMPQEDRHLLMEFGDAVFQVFGPRNELWEKGVREGADAIAYVERSCRRDALAPDGIGAAISASADAGEVDRAGGQSCSSRRSTRPARTRRSSPSPAYVEGDGRAPGPVRRLLRDSTRRSRATPSRRTCAASRRARIGSGG